MSSIYFIFLFFCLNNCISLRFKIQSWQGSDILLIFELQSILDDKNITVSELSKATNISRPSINAMCNNTSKSVNIEFLEKIMKYLNVGLTDLIKDFEDTVNMTFFKRKKGKSTKKTRDICRVNAYHNEKKVFEGEVGILLSEFIDNFNDMYKKKENVSYPNENEVTDAASYVLIAEPTMIINNTSLSQGQREFATEQRSNLTALFSLLGEQNTERFIIRFLMEISELNRENDKPVVITVRVPQYKTYVYTLDGTALISLTAHKNKANNYASPRMRINIENES